MTPQERQEILIERRNHFKPIVHNFIGKPDDKIAFRFEYEGEEKLLACEPDCSGCTTVSIDFENNAIVGELHLNENYQPVTGQPSTPITKYVKVWFDDGEPWVKIDENGRKHNNDEKVHVPLYLQGQVDLR